MWTPLFTRTALAAALNSFHVEAVKMLLANGADANINTVEWRNQYIIHSNLLKILIEGGLSRQGIQRSFIHAAYQGNYNKFVLLLDYGAKVDLPFLLCEPDSPICDVWEWMASAPGPWIKSDHYSSPEWERVMSSPEWAVFADSHFIKASSPLMATIQYRSTKGDERDHDYFKCFNLLLDAGADIHSICERTYRHGDHVYMTPDYAIPTLGRQTILLCTASYYGHLDMIQALVERGVDVNHTFEVQGEQFTALRAAIDSENFLDTRERRHFTSLGVQETLHLLVGLGANLDLCGPDHNIRAQQLLHMPPQDCQQMASLQRQVKQTDVGFQGTRPINIERSFQDRRSALVKLIQNGADPKLCCERDQRAIREMMSWSDEEVRYHDQLRENSVAVLFEVERTRNDYDTQF